MKVKYSCLCSLVPFKLCLKSLDLCSRERRPRSFLPVDVLPHLVWKFSVRTGGNPGWHGGVFIKTGESDTFQPLFDIYNCFGCHSYNFSSNLLTFIFSIHTFYLVYITARKPNQYLWRLIFKQDLIFFMLVCSLTIVYDPQQKQHWRNISLALLTISGLCETFCIFGLCSILLRESSTTEIAWQKGKNHQWKI